MRKTFWISFAPALAYMAFIFWLSSQPDPPVLGPLPINDKIKHLALYGVFSVTLWRAFSARFRTRPAAVAACTVAFASFYGATDEFHQRFTPGRSCDVHDWIADTGAAILVVMGFLIWQSRRRPPEPLRP